MIWDGNGYPVKRCCAKCRTPYNCGNARCGCHDEAGIGSERPDLVPSAPVQGSGVLADRYDTVTPQAVTEQNEPTRRK